MEREKNPESTVSRDIIDKVHLTLVNFKKGEEMLSFLRSTEPIFMGEVSRFVSTEMDRLKRDIGDERTLYIGSVVAAAYVSGFLIAREAQHALFDGTMGSLSPVDKIFSPKELDKLMDKYRAEGKSHKEIASCIRKHLNLEPKKKTTKSKKKKPDKGKRLKLDDFDK